jgi:hypothetical protein
VNGLLHAVKQLENKIKEWLRATAQCSDVESLKVHDDLETEYSIVLVLSPDQLQAFVHDSNAMRFSRFG